MNKHIQLLIFSGLSISSLLDALHALALSHAFDSLILFRYTFLSMSLSFLRKYDV